MDRFVVVAAVAAGAGAVLLVGVGVRGGHAGVVRLGRRDW